MSQDAERGLLALRLSELAGRTGAGVKVAVVDSGVHEAHPHVQGVAGGAGFDPAGREHGDFVDRLGHGTAVAAVIRERAPRAEIHAAKVFDRALATSAEALVAAIGWSVRRGAHLLNLSLGTLNAAHEAALAPAVARARGCGTLVIAAGAQEGNRWLPGCLPGVVPVVLDWDLPRDECRVSLRGDGGVELRASGYPRPIPGVPPERNLRGLSFAVANATALLALVLEGAPAGRDLETRLAACCARSRA